MKRIVIVTGGSLPDIHFYRRLIKRDDFIICADGGANNADRMGVWPNALVGDFDSIDLSLLRRFKQASVKIISYPREKNETDTQLALDYAVSLKPDEIVLRERWESGPPTQWPMFSCLSELKTRASNARSSNLWAKSVGFKKR